MSTYTWKIESVNIDAGTMEVSYDVQGQVTTLNLPTPDDDGDIGAWIDQFAPRSLWKARPITVLVGSTGSGQLTQPGPTSPEYEERVGHLQSTPLSTAVPTSQSDSWNEEYLRAMIYQVMLEVQAAEKAA